MRKENCSCLLTVEYEDGCQKRRPYNRQSLTSMGFPLLQKTGEMCSDRQIDVPGKFWNFNRGRMNEEETATLFTCTVRGFQSRETIC